MENQNLNEEKIKILIADDELLVAANVKNILQRYNYTVLEIAGSAKKAVELARTEKPDLILMDINLKDEIDGIEAAKIISTFSDVPVIFVTAYSDNSTISRAKSMGPYGYIIKPYNAQDLYAAIEMALYKYSMERRLVESEERFRMLFDKAPLGYQSLDENGNFIDVNEAWLDVLGYKHDEVIGKWFGDFLAPEYRQAFRERFPLFKTRGNIHSEFNMIHKDGSVHYISFEGRIGYNLNGKFKQTHCILADITEQKKAEIALKASEEKYRDLINGMNDSVFVIDYDTSILDVNNSAIEVLGYTREEFLSMKVSDIDTNLKPEQIQNLADSLANDKKQVFETSHTTKAGNKIPVEISSSLVSYNGRTVIMSIARDITERKLAETELKESELRFKTTLDYTYDWEYWEDENGQIVYMSPSCQRITGYSRENFVNDSRLLDAIVHPDDLTSFSQHHQNVYVQSDKTDLEELEFKIIAKDGSIKIINHFCRPIFDEKNNFKGRRVSNRDITDHKKAEQEVKASEERFQLLFKNSRDGIFFSEPGGRILGANEAACNILGMTEEEIIRGSRRKIIDESDPRLIPALNERKQKGFFFGELTFVRKNGEKFPIELSSVIYADKDGNERASIIFRDISERVSSENALRESENKLRSIFDTMSEGVALNEVIYDDNGEIIDYRILEVNKAFYSIADYHSIDLIGNLASNVYGMSQDLIREFWIKNKANQKVVVTEMQSPINNKWFYISTSPLINNMFVTTFQDITERKNAEKELNDHMNEIIRFNKLMVGRELRMVELKNEVNSLLEQLGKDKKYSINKE